ncbi:peptide ABC transporter substrate-binding protein [Bordetella genomosp. 7]|uniref:ABC transporter substrate-binding protein n=1 Tax=Bordetella genomosp. 7 TaxID=1416805 RepID=UPI000B9E3BB6|nr:ABC transporter substrate-binding protein [Bordetella genomosp. 7]OZI15701.1 peptide ABC transporter substrate-binding protein [Bordetella genomosp. 7]
MQKHFLLTAAVAALCATSTVAATTLRVHQDADIRSTDPGVNRDGNTDGVVLHMVEGLVGYDAKGQPQPLLAERIEVSDDGLAYTFHLREGVKFHNGKPLTADDVLWSWNRFMDPKTGWRCLSDFDGRVRLKVEEVTAPDAKTVVFRINHPDPLFLSSLARNDCGMTAITHRDSLKADGTWDKPIGTGPFKLGEWRQREYISLVRNDDYASLPGGPDGYVGSKRPLVDEVRFVVISDPATAKTALASGAIDLMSKVPYSEMSELQNHADIATTVSPQLSPTTFPLQTRDKLLSNTKLRQAIAAALDYKQLVDGVTYGLAEPNNSLVPSESPFFGEAQARGFQHDPARVRKLLAEAGYKGEKIVISTNRRNQPNYDAAVIAQAMLQQAGINADIEVLEWGAQQDKWQKGNYQMMSFSYSSRMDPSLSFEGVMGPKDTQPRKVWDDAESLELLTQSMRETDPAQRQKMFDDLHARMLEQVPLIPIFNTLATGAYRKNVSGFESSVFGTPQLWEVSKKD